MKVTREKVQRALFKIWANDGKSASVEQIFLDERIGGTMAKAIRSLNLYEKGAGKSPIRWLSDMPNDSMIDAIFSRYNIFRDEYNKERAERGAQKQEPTKAPEMTLSQKERQEYFANLVAERVVEILTQRAQSEKMHKGVFSRIFN